MVWISLLIKALVVRAEITEEEIRNNIINDQITKLALMTTPVDAQTNMPKIYAEGDSSVYSLQSTVLAKRKDSTENIYRISAKLPLRSNCLPSKKVIVAL